MDCRIIKLREMKNREIIKYSIALFLVSLTINAQETFPDDVDDVDDVLSAPLNGDYLPLLVFAGIVLVYRFAKMKILTDE